jgi:hypothetical protein
VYTVYQQGRKNCDSLKKLSQKDPAQLKTVCCPEKYSKFGPDIVGRAGGRGRAGGSLI